MKAALVLTSALLSTAPDLVLAGDWSVTSGARQASLIELYTSQGCSSCPPADQWLSSFVDDEALWSTFVPVAFHVTYWDYLGWRDPFGSPANDRRQRMRAARARAGVYTPGVFVNHGEWRGWRRGSELPARPDVGVLTANGGGDRIRVRFEPSIAVFSPRVELAFVTGDSATDVTAGENRRRRLRHDFVAGHRHVTKLRQRSPGVWVGELHVASMGGPSRPDAVALWVLDGEDQYLQAAGGWLQKSAE